MGLESSILFTMHPAYIAISQLIQLSFCLSPFGSLPIPSMGLVYLPIHEWLLFMLNVGKYTIHGYGMGIIKPFSPSSSAAFVSIFANRCPFLLRGFTRVVFFESVRCSSKSDSNGIDHVEHWIFSPHMDGDILQIQDSPTLYTNRHIQWHQTPSPKKTSTTNATHYACQDGSFWKVTWTHEAHCLPQWKKKTFSHWVISDDDQRGFLKVFKRLESEWNLVHAKKKKVLHPAVSCWRVAVKMELKFLPGGNAFVVFGHLSNQRKHVNVDVSKNCGTQQPWVFLLKMIILGCFGGTPIFGNTHVLYLPSSFLMTEQILFLFTHCSKKSYLF